MGVGWGAFQRNIRAGFKGLEHRHRLAAAALACLSLASVFVAGRHNSFYLLADIVVACGVTFLAAVFALRHAGLAALVASAPLPGVSAFLAAVPAPDAPLAARLCLGLGLVVSVLIGETVAASAASGDTGARIPGWVARGNTRLVTAILAVFLVPALVRIGVFGAYFFLDVAEAGALSVASAAVVVHLGASYCDFGEEYIARANRARERFARLFAPILPVARPRFGFSVFGIACVMGAMAFFGTRPLHLGAAISVWAIPLVAAPVAASSYAVLRDWRRCLAVLLSVALAAQAAIWLFARGGLAITSKTQAELLIAVSAIYALQLFDAQEASGAIATEEDAIAGSERAIETGALPVCVAGFVGAAAMLPGGGSDLSTWACCGIAILAGVVCAVLFQPAIAITIESLVPRAATIAARYRL